MHVKGFEECIAYTADKMLLSEMTGFISSSASICGLSAERIKEIELASEEALVNIINYAYEGTDSGKVIIRCVCEDLDFKVEIADYGPAFNPLEVSAPDLTQDLEDRKIGGLGVFFIKSFMDFVEYRREDGKNILSMTAVRRT